MSWIGKPAPSKAPSETQLDLADLEMANDILRDYMEGRLHGVQGERSYQRAVKVIEDIKRRQGWR